ncbi:hypothetical protein SEA_HUWBERT_91 [Microbacterium phage Huwbert]|nr:hypothetical protein SEA_HUWBERT_91 [Microbacterium phage Huwbert]
MGYTEATLKKKSVTELKELAEDLFDEDELDAITTKAPLIEKLLENDSNADEADDDDELEDDDEAEDEADDEADDEVDDTESDEVDDDEEDDIEMPEVDDIEPAKPAKAKASSKKTKYTEGGKDGEGNKLLGAKEVATNIGTDAKTLRQFFRSGKSSFTAVGAGGRYEFSEADLPKIKAEFETWKTNKPGRGRAADGDAAPKKSRSRGKAAAKPEDTIDEVDEVEDLDDLDDIELD